MMGMVPVERFAAPAGSGHGNDHVHIQPDQFDQESGQAVAPALRSAILDNDLLPFHVA